MATTSRGLLPRIAASARSLLPAVLIAFAWLVASLLAEGMQRGATPLSLLIAAGARAFALAVLYAAITLLHTVVTRLPLRSRAKEREPSRQRSLARAVVAVGVAAMLWGVLLAASRAFLPLLVPERLAFRQGIQDAVLTFACAGLAWLVTTRLVRLPLRSLTSGGLGLLLLLAARVLTLADLERYASAYRLPLELGTLVLVFVACVTTAGTRATPVPLPVPLRIVGALFLASVAALFWVTPRSPSVRSRLSDALPGPASLVVAEALLFDFDRDGFPSLIVPLDCDDSDPHIHPLALERVGNGIDDNCTGGDLASVEPYQAAVVTHPKAPRHNVVMITIDTVHADTYFKGAAGSTPMPRLAHFAQEAAVFSEAYSQAPFTFDALLSLQTGDYPMALSMGKQRLGNEPFIAELLRARGYKTLAQHQFWEEGKGAAHFRFYQGFEVIDDRIARQNTHLRTITSRQTTDHALAHVDALRASTKPFYFWVHYLDPHGEYMPHEGTPYSHDDSDRGRYLQELWFTDRQIGRLLDHLEQTGLLESTLVVICGDHGEYFGEQGRYGHAYWLTRTTLRTLLVMRGPGVEPGVFQPRVRLIDVYPTVLELAASIRKSSSGASLRPIWEGTETTDRDVVSRSQYKNMLLRSIVSGDLMLIEDLGGATVELYDLERDPEQRVDLSSAQPQDVAALRARLGRVVDRSINDVVLGRRLSARR